MTLATMFDGMGKSFGDGFTRAILQPIVAERQQLIRVDRYRSLQPMVAPTKNDAKKLFAERLNELLDHADAPKRGRAKWLAVRFKGEFSREAARKWLDAESMPDQAHLSMMCAYFGWAVDYVFSGLGPKYVRALSPELTEIVNDWHRVNHNHEGKASILRNFRLERDAATRTQKLLPAPPADDRDQRPDQQKGDPGR